MDTISAAKIADELLHAHNLSQWTFVIDHARQRCGACHFKAQQISLSKHFVTLNDDAEVRATLLHEIAHALCGPGAGHGPVWQRTAARIGAPVQTTNDRARMPAETWHLVCQNCTQTVAKRHRRSLNLANVRCRSCGPGLGHLDWQAATPT